MKITFIIPVYNVELYIENCIQSVLNAWGKEKEIFLVLGNSTDRSNLICEKYGKEYSEILVIYQDGKGLSNARNCALKQATGEYVLFIDGDDHIDSQALQIRLNLLEHMKKRPDILASDFIAVDEDGKKVRESHCILQKEDIQTGDTAMAEYLEGAGGIWNVWRYIYRLAFFRECGLVFEENTRCEDVIFTIRAFGKAELCAFLSRPYYYYRLRRTGALTTCIDAGYVSELLNILDSGYREFEYFARKDIAELLKRKIEREYVLNLAYVYEVKKNEREKTIRLYQQHSWLLKDSDSIFYRLFERWISGRGIIIPAAVLYIIKKYRRKYF